MNLLGKLSGGLGAYLFEDGVFHLGGNRGVLQRFHDRRGPAGAHRAEFGGVAEHFAQRDFGFDDAGVAALVAVDDEAAAAVEIAGHVADEFFRAW